MGLGFEGRKTLPSLLLSLARSRRAAGRGATMGWQGGWVGGLQGGEVMWQRRRKTTCSLASAPPSHVSRHVASKAFSQLDLEQRHKESLNSPLTPNFKFILVSRRLRNVGPTLLVNSKRKPGESISGHFGMFGNDFLGRIL